MALSAAKRNTAGGGRTAVFNPVYQSSEADLRASSAGPLTAIDGTVGETVEVISTGVSVHGDNEGGDDDDEDVDWEEGDDAGGEPLAEDRDLPVHPEKSCDSQGKASSPG